MNFPTNAPIPQPTNQPTTPVVSALSLLSFWFLYHLLYFPFPRKFIPTQTHYFTTCPIYSPPKHPRLLPQMFRRPCPRPFPLTSPSLLQLPSLLTQSIVPISGRREIARSSVKRVTGTESSKAVNRVVEYPFVLGIKPYHGLLDHCNALFFDVWVAIML